MSKSVWYTFCFLLGSWFVLAIRNIFLSRRIKQLTDGIASCHSCKSVCELCQRNILRVPGFTVDEALKGVKSIKEAWSREHSTMRFPSVEPDDYSDSDKDGVPDVFQRRKPLSEILEFEKPSENHSNDYWVAIELPARSPKKGEYCLVGTMIIQAGHDFSSSSDFIIVKSVPGTNLDDLVDLTK